MKSQIMTLVVIALVSYAAGCAIAALVEAQPQVQKKK